MSTTYIALLRAVNLGAHNKVAMADLRELLGTLGMRNTRTLLQSGNAVFESDLSSSELERILEAGARTQLRLSTDFMVRTKRSLVNLVAANPFHKEAANDPGHLVAMFLKARPAATAIATLQGAIRGRESVRAKGRELYVVYPDGIGNSRLTTAVIERALGTRATGRNWNTVLKLLRLA